ncbi:unnamed protein product [Effrenium voratum]|uniref:STAS domain-containing protein n=1 Tax=Effrenium voratum TaxID=2562239 RepID=A0AA36NB60_9DINO|nr:unnamed protein product [Effrenium voratum]
MDCTFADQTRLLVLSLEREGAKVLLSSLRSKTVRRLLDAHGICNGSSRKVFNTLDQAIQHCEDLILAEAGKLRKPHSGGEWPLQDLLLEYVEGFIPDGAKAREAAATAAKHFERIQLKQSQLLFRSEDPADAIFVVAQGVVGAAYSTTFLGNLEMLPSPPSSAICRQETPQLELDFPFVEEVQADGRDFEEHGVGAILNDAAFYARRKCGADAVAKTDCVVFRLPRKALARMEEEEPGAAVLLQKVLLRDLSQLMAQFLCPLQAVAGLS